MSYRSFLTALSSILPAALLAAACQAPNSAAGEGTPAKAESASLAGFGPGAPAWAKTGALPKYPHQQFITGLGYSPPGMPEADAMSQAKLAAFKDISDQIETQVSNEFTSIQRSVFHNEDVDELVDLKSVSKQVTEELLAGAEVKERYYDAASGTGAAFAVMDRLKLSERMLKEAEEARSRLDGFMQSFEKAAAAGVPSDMLKDLIHAQAALDRIVGAHLKAIAVGATQAMFDRFQSLNDPTLAARIAREAGALKDRIQILPVSGNEQRALLTGRLAQPVEVKAVWRGPAGEVPVEGFPMRVQVDDAAKAVAVPAAKTTDGQGLFAFQLQELKATGAASNAVRVELDFSDVEKKCTLTPPAGSITYFMPTPDTTRIGVIIHETIDGRENANPFVGSAIKKALVDLGFQVIRLEEGRPASEIVGWPPSKMVEEFGSQCDYLVAGTSETERSSSVGAMIFFRSRLVIDAVELATGKTIHLEVPFEQTKAAGDTPEKAARASLNKANECLMGDPKSKKPGLLSEKFAARFEKGEDWSE